MHLQEARRLLWQWSGLREAFNKNKKPIISLSGVCKSKFFGEQTEEKKLDFLLGLKERLTELFGVPVTVPTLHFYKIKNRAPVFRKKRNTNINLNFKFTYSRVTELESIVSLVVSLRGLTYFLRKNYRLHTGYFVQLLGNSLIITFINPFLAYNFLKYCSGEQPLEMSVDDQVIVTVRLYSKHKFILRSLLFLLKT